MNFDTNTSPLVKLRNYITEDVISAISSMDKDEMNASLVELSGTRHWIAILRYSMERMSFAQSSLFSLDPFKDQTSMARLQGIVTGMTDLPDAVYGLVHKSNDIVKKEEE